MSKRPIRAAALRPQFTQNQLEAILHDEGIENDASESSNSQLAPMENLSVSASESDASDGQLSEELLKERDGSDDDVSASASFGGGSSSETDVVSDDDTPGQSNHNRPGRHRVEDNAEENALSDDEVDDQVFIPTNSDRLGEEPMGSGDDMQAIEDVKKAAHKLKSSKIVAGIASGRVGVSSMSTTSNKPVSKSSSRTVKTPSILTTQEKAAAQYEKVSSSNSPVGISNTTLNAIRKQYKTDLENDSLPGVAQFRKDYGLLYNKPAKEYAKITAPKIKEMLFGSLGIIYTKPTKARSKK